MQAIPTYETRVIRDLLLAAFSAEELTIFIFDHFPDVYEQLTVGMTRLWQAHLLIDYCVRHRSLDELLSLVRKANPEQYNYFMFKQEAKEGQAATRSDRGQLTVELKGIYPVRELSPEQERALTGAISGILEISREQVHLLYTGRGSLVVRLQLPLDVTERFAGLYKASTLIQELGIQHVEAISYPLEREMILIPAGEFLMGSNPNKDKEAEEDEQPQHTLYLPDYYLSKTPVTNAQYLAFVQATDHRQPDHWKDGKPPSGKEDHPVVYVNWYDAVAYCNWLAEVTGNPYRLPSEAEWEKGARGSNGRIYPWGNQWDPKRCNFKEGDKGETTPVADYPSGASPYGLLDMAGNVWDWTSSLYWSYPYRAEDGREDLDASGLRVLRGGSWRSDRDWVRSAYRERLQFSSKLDCVGFRCCVAFTP